jgi:hypothetical protein
LIYFNGCSFTNGYELEQKFKHRFSSLVCAHFNEEEDNDAKVGGSNDRIWRTTMNHCLSNKYDAVVIMRTGNNRMEYLQTGENISGNVFNNAIWLNSVSKDYLNQPRWRSTNWLTDGISKFQSLHGNKIYKHPDQPERHWLITNGFMKTVRNRQYNLKYSISYMLSTKYFLESLGIPYLFYTYSSGQYKPFLYLLDEDYLEAANNYWDSKELSKKQIIKELPCLLEDGFYDITKKAGLPVGKKDHPLAEAHRLMADIIIKDLEKKYETNKKDN